MASDSRSPKADDVRKSATWPEFRIVSGAHRDAVFALGNEDLLVIGADESCDIRLSDAGVAPRHATLMSQGAMVSVRRLDGAVCVGSQAIAASVRAPLQAGADVTLGESGVKLQLCGPPEAQPNGGRDVKATRREPRRSRAITLATLSMVIVACAGIATQKLYASRAAKPQGTVATPRPPVVNSGPTKEELVEQVRDIFRTYGYHAAVTYFDERGVRVENLDGNHERVREVAARVRSDIPQLRQLTFADPTAAPLPDRAESYESVSGDHISARVDGDTAYLAAAGGARYFVGSVLPSGHTVLRIAPSAAQVERDGEISWFTF